MAETVEKQIQELREAEVEYERLQQTQNLDTKDLNIIRDYTDDGTGVWASEIQAIMDGFTLKAIYFSEDWVYILVDRIASKISAVPLRVMRTEMRDGTKVYIPDEGHPVQARIEEPNMYQNYTQWMYRNITDFCVLGNTVIWKTPQNGQLVPLPGELVRINFDPGTWMRKNYQIMSMNYNDGTAGLLKNVMNLPVEQVIHIMRPNPSSLLWGLSALIPGRKSVLFNRYSTEYLNSYYQKGAQPGIALEMDKEANEKHALRLLRSFEQAHTGRKNQRRPLVLPKGVTVKEVGASLADQQLKEYILLNRETIINLFQVPKHELSIAETGSLGSEEYKTALKNFWSGPLKSIMTLVADSLTKAFRQELGDGRFLEFDLSDVDVLQDDQMKKAQLATEMLKTHTINEVRKKLYDEAPLPDGDATPVILLPTAVRGATAPGQPPMAGLPPAAPVGASVIAPVALEAAPMDTPETLATQDTEAKAATLKKNGEVFSTFTKAEGKNWWDKRQSKLDVHSNHAVLLMHERALQLFADQAEALVKATRKNIQEKAADVPSKAKLRQAIRDAMDGFEQQWLDDYTKILKAQVDLGYDIALEIPFNLPAKNEIAVLRARNENKRLSILEERGLKTFSQMSATTTDKVVGIVADGVEANKTVQEIAADIKDYFTNEELTTGRAMMIARTEALTASSVGQAAAMSDAAEVVPDLLKMWINAGDDRVRGNPDGKYPHSEADHWSLQNEVRGWDDKFSNGLLYPRDLDGPPDETIQCRCTTIMVPKADADKLGLGKFV